MAILEQSGRDVNIVLLVVDTLRADHLSAYGYRRDTAPRLTELAARGVRFERCFAQNNATHPSFTTLMTGLHPLNHGIVGHMGKRQLDDRIPVLAEVLREHGYLTGAVDTMGRWFTRGFDDYMTYVFDQRETAAMRSGEQANALASDFLHQAGGAQRPFFLFVHYWDPHTPYLPPAPFDRLYVQDMAESSARRRGDALAPAFAFQPLARYLRRWMGAAPNLDAVAARYDGEIAYVDQCIGRLLDDVESLGLSDDTLIVVTGDHGESLGEHGIYYDHHGLYDPQLRVPLIMSHPSRLPRGTVLDATVRHMDVAPTILDFAGLVDRMPCEGVSLRACIDGQEHPAGTSVLACEATWQLKVALRRPDWKLIRSLQPDDYGNPPVELYDLRCDPLEQCNVAGERPEVANELGRELDPMMARELELGGHRRNPLEDGITLRPIFGLSEGEDDEAMRAGVVEHLEAEGHLAHREVYTPEEEALIEERLSNLGYL
jgi:arylsulfatase A-like enzyme